MKKVQQKRHAEEVSKKGGEMRLKKRKRVEDELMTAGAVAKKSILSYLKSVGE